MRNTQRYSNNLLSETSSPKSLTLLLLVFALVSFSTATGCGAFLDTFKSKDDKVQKDQKPSKNDGKQDVNDDNGDADGTGGTGSVGGTGDGEQDGDESGTVGGGGTGSQDGDGDEQSNGGDEQSDSNGTDDAVKKRCEKSGPLSAPIPNCRPKIKPPSGDPQQDCVDRTNQLRWECQCLPPLQRWHEGEACAKEHAEYDAAHRGPHKAFGRNICTPGGWAQNEGMMYTSFHDFNDRGLQKMWDEGPGEPFQDHGHYLNMSSLKFTKVACAKASNAKWYVQNFSN